MNPAERDECVARTLSEWRVDPPRNPQFRAAVWARIRGGGHGAAWADYARAHGLAVAGALALALALGGWAGRERAQARVAADRAEIARTYVQALDARAMAMQ